MADLGSYKEVPVEEEENQHLVGASNDDHDLSTKGVVSRRRDWYRGKASLFWALGCLFILAASVVSTRLFACPLDSSLVYSPAEEAPAHHRSVYPDAFDTKTHFMGDPSPQLDDYWDQSYDVITRIPKWQADKLVQPSIEIPDDKGYYAVLLDIFHSMHCLNEIRKSLHPEYYAPYHLRMNGPEEEAQKHLDHCVEHVRLALWCGADISPISFRWTKDGEAKGQAKGKGGYAHTCRDGRSILNWARQHKFRNSLP